MTIPREFSFLKQIPLRKTARKIVTPKNSPRDKNVDKDLPDKFRVEGKQSTVSKGNNSAVNNTAVPSNGKIIPNADAPALPPGTRRGKNPFSIQGKEQAIKSLKDSFKASTSHVDLKA